jgi:hypothetical protein
MAVTVCLLGKLWARDGLGSRTPGIFPEGWLQARRRGTGGYRATLEFAATGAGLFPILGAVRRENRDPPKNHG